MIGTAFLFAMEAHRGQKRKDGRDYIVHPLEVAMELAKNGADDATICAGFLHDTLEDTAVTEEELKNNFPEEVVSLVKTDSEDKRLTWEERKQQMLDSLKSSDAARNYKMLMCADKLVNLKNIKMEQEKIGDAVFDRFKRGKESQKWFFDGLVDVLQDLSDLKMYQELKELTEAVFKEYK